MNDNEFNEACEAAKVSPGKRQFKKWQKHKGIAYRVKRGELSPLSAGTTHQHGYGWRPPK